MSTRVLLTRVLLALGLTFLAGGLLLGYLPRTAGGVSCGSAFHGSRSADIADIGRALRADELGVSFGNLESFADRCESARSATRIPAVVLLVVGAALTVSGSVAASSVGERPTRPDVSQLPGYNGEPY